MVLVVYQPKTNRLDFELLPFVQGEHIRLAVFSTLTLGGEVNQPLPLGSVILDKLRTLEGVLNLKLDVVVARVVMPTGNERNGTEVMRQFLNSLSEVVPVVLEEVVPHHVRLPNVIPGDFQFLSALLFSRRKEEMFLFRVARSSHPHVTAGTDVPSPMSEVRHSPGRVLPISAEDVATSIGRR